MPKPWHIATNDSFLFEALSCPCPGPEAHPVHATVQGKYTKGTESYTDEMVKLIHQGWRRSCVHAAMCTASPKEPVRGASPAAPAPSSLFTSSCPPMVVPMGTLCCSHQEACVAAARTTVASAKDISIAHIEVVSKGVYRHQRLPSGRAALWPRVTKRTTSCLTTGRVISCDEVRCLEHGALTRDLNPQRSTMDVKTKFTLDAPLTQEDEELHCPAMPTTTDWKQGHRTKNEYS